MSDSATQVNVAYFGKIPTKGDFVKAGNSLALLNSLDQWLAKAMNELSEDSRWKLIYDAVKPFSFAFLGPRNKLAIAGHFVASSDAAQRRFPFITAGAMEVDNPSSFAARSPLVFSRLWNRLASMSGAVLAAADPAQELQNVAASTVPVELGTSAYNANFSDYLELQTVSSLDGQLLSSGFNGNCRQLIIALGLLLQPVMASGSNRLEKALCLPLPIDPMYQYLTAALWLDLTTPFLQRADFELSLYITTHNNYPALIIGFDGASSYTLEAVLNPRIGEEHFIVFDDATWVEEHASSDYGTKKLSSYLEQPRLSLTTARSVFNEIFLGN